MDLGGLDQLVFTGGIGENSSTVREMVCSQLKHIGVKLDEDANKSCRDGVMSTADSAVKVSVIPANEELGIARNTYDYLT